MTRLRRVAPSCFESRMMSSSFRPKNKFKQNEGTIFIMDTSDIRIMSVMRILSGQETFTLGGYKARANSLLRYACSVPLLVVP